MSQKIQVIVDSIRGLWQRAGTASGLLLDGVNLTMRGGASLSNVSGSVNLSGASVDLTSASLTGGTFTGLGRINSMQTLAPGDAVVAATLVDYIFFNASGSRTSYTLPPAGDNTGRTTTVKKIDATSTPAHVSGSAGETIDGSSIVTMTTPNLSLTLISSGGLWYIV